MPLSLIDTRTSRILFTAILFALGLGLVYAARRTLIWFLFAIFFAYLMAPAVSRLERVLHSRGRAIASIYLLMAALLIVFFMYLGPQVARQAARMGGALPNLLESVGSGEIAEQIGTEHGLSGQTQQQLKIFLATHRDSIMGFAQRGGIRAAEFAQQMPVLFLIPILAIFFLRDGKTFGGVLLTLVHTRPQRELLEGVLHDLNKMLAHFIARNDTRSAFRFRLQQLSGIDARSQRAHAWDTGWNARICPRGRPNRRCCDDPGRRCIDELPLLDMDSGFSRAVAPCSGLSRFPADHGKEHGTAPSGSHLRCFGWRRDRWRARRLPIDPGDGQFAHRVAPLATLCGKAQVWPSQRVFVRTGHFHPEIGYNSHSLFPRERNAVYADVKF